MTKMHEMLAAGIPVIENKSNEAIGQFAFEAMSDDQRKKLDSIFCARASSLAADSNVIIGDGVDEIVLTVSGEPGSLVTVNTLAGATAGTISIQLDADGNGSQVFSCETSPTAIVFSLGDSIVKVRAL